MQETSRAAQAWNDYLAMGTERSMEKLSEQYQSRTGNVPTRQLSRLKVWSTVFGWQARLDEIVEQERQSIVTRGIIDKQNRIDAYNDRWARMKQVIRERGEDSEMQSVPGGKTGLLVRSFKILGKGEDARELDEYAVDTGILKEMRELEKQAATEMGQWTEKKELTGKDGGPITIQPVDYRIAIGPLAPDDQAE